MSEDVTLTVKVASQEDIGRKIARIGTKVRMELDIEVGDPVMIIGEDKTVANVYRLPSDDEGNDIIRIDGLVRKNAKVSVGEEVKVRKAKTDAANELKLAPLIEEGNKLRFGEGIDGYVKKGVLNRSFMKGDVVLIPGIAVMGGSVPFLVLNIQPVGPVKITKETEITVKEEPVDEEELVGPPTVTYEDVGGLEQELQRVREMIELPLKHPKLFDRMGIEPPKGVLLYGPPGTGKTWIAKAVANEAGAKFFSVQGPEIMSKYYGQSEGKLRDIFEKAKENSPSIIFIDELDSIAPKRDDVKGEVERRVVAQLLSLMDGLTRRGRTIVIAATNREGAIDPALRRPGRFDREIEIGLPDKDGRKEILQIHTRNMPLSEEVDLGRLAEDTHGFAGADLESLAKEGAMRALRRYIPQFKLDESIPTEIVEKMEVNPHDFGVALREIEPSSLREIMMKSPDVKWDDVGGLKDIKEKLKDAVEKPIKEPGYFREMGISPSKGVLLYGPPGTGKTLLAEAAAHETGANFIPVKGPEILSKWVGESEKAIREMFSKAKQAAPSIIFMDELDALTPERGQDGVNQVTDRVVNQLLTDLDKIDPKSGIIVIAATNRPDKIDPALLRAGRFDNKLMASIPDEEDREEIFKIHTDKMKLSDGVDFQELVEKTDSYVGADIESICKSAAMQAIKEEKEAVDMDHFLKSIEETAPSVDEEVLDIYDKIDEVVKKSVRKKKDYNGVGLYR